MAMSTAINMKARQNSNSCTMQLFLRLRFHWRSIIVIAGAAIILSQLFLFHAQKTKIEMLQVQLRVRQMARDAGIVTMIERNNDNISNHKKSISKHHENPHLQKKTQTKKPSKSKVDAASNDNKQKIPKHKDHPKFQETTFPATPSLSPLDVIKAYHAHAIRFRHRFNCPAIINGSQTAIREVREFLLHDRPPEGYPLSEPVVSSQMFQDCDSYKRIRKYVLEAGTPEEERFPLAYVILAHQDFDHLERLLRIFYRPEHVFCIHLDDKVGADLKKAVHGLASCFPNVRMASKPQIITYATMSRLMGDYVCMKDLVTDNKPWKYLINMAATSLPIQTNKQIVKRLTTIKGQNDITMRYAARIPSRWEVEYFVGGHGYIRPSKRKHVPAPHNITVIKGMAYNTYSREFLDWTMTDQRAIDLLEWSSKTYSPDEHYWATLNNMYHNPHLKAPGGSTQHPDKHRDSTFIAKFNRQGQKCEGKSNHRVCLLEVGELTFVKAHHWYRTANKFDLTYDPVAYTCMEESIENRTETGAPFR